MSQNLNTEELAQWRSTCKKMRALARENPCYDIRMVMLDDYGTRLGPWNLRLVLLTCIKPAIYQASVSLIKEIGDELVYDEHGVPLFDVPKAGIVCVDDWTHEDLDEARSLLGDLMGPLINREDQRVNEGYVKGGMALNWTTEMKDAHQRVELLRI